MDLFYEREQYMMLYRSSHLFLISTLYAFIKEHYMFSFVNGCVFLTSINYWRMPKKSWRRTLDMIVVNSAIMYKNITIYNSSLHNPYNVNLYYLIFSTGSISYPISIYYYNQKYYWTAVYLHMLLHMMANVANVVLYWGCVCI